MDTDEKQVHHHHHHHEVHYSRRSGHNRHTKSQKRRRLLSNLLFIFLSIIAAIIIAINLYDHYVGLFKLGQTLFLYQTAALRITERHPSSYLERVRETY